MPAAVRLLLPLLLCAAPVRAETFRVAVLPPAGDKVAAKFADGVELNLEGNESVAVVPRDDVRGRLDSDAAFDAKRLKGILGKLNVDILVRVTRVEGPTGPLAVTVYDRDGLDVDQFEVGVVKTPADAKPRAKSTATLLAGMLPHWDEKRSARKERAAEEEAIATRSPAKTPPAQDWDAETVKPDEEPIPPPPEPESRPASSRGRTARVVEEPREEETPPFATETRRPARTARSAPPPEETPPPRRAPRAAAPSADEDSPPPRRTTRRAAPVEEPAEEAPVEAPRPRRRPAPRPRGLLLDDKDGPKAEEDGWFKPGWLERWAKGLYSLDQPTPYFIVSAGPQGLIWSYALTDATLQKRKTSVCAPDPKALAATLLGCTPHGGGDLWLEAWPVRYLGVDASLRGDGTVYRPPRDPSGRPLTTPSYVPAAVVEGHVAAKARFVLTVGPVPGASVGARVRVGYARSSVWEQKPFVGVPGYHAAQLGAGLEGYLPLLWKHLSFDVRAELVPLVVYQETSGFPLTATEMLLPMATLNNPGSSSVTMGYRVDAGVRGVIVYGAFVELRGFQEGFGAYFTGVGKRKDRFLRPIPDGRVANVSTGLTLAAGWLFPQFL